jgi:hypothetical protein
MTQDASDAGKILTLLVVTNDIDQEANPGN